jgi:7-carboxy-7-deazaguanine synthase
MTTLRINEIYTSIQGESTFAGLPCVFIRTTCCDLRCTYCDTEHAFYEGSRMSIEEILARVEAEKINLIEVTGGEPLLQHGCPELLSTLCNAGYRVLLETSGAHDISKADQRVHRIMDIKCPSSGEATRFYKPNIEQLTRRDEVKFVIGSREDYDYARDIIQQHNLADRVHAVLLSAVFKLTPRLGHVAGHAGIDPRLIVQWMLQDKLPARFQLQMHKFIWPPDQRGV